jgi:hypothetical protein
MRPHSLMQSLDKAAVGSCACAIENKHCASRSSKEFGQKNHAGGKDGTILFRAIETSLFTQSGYSGQHMGTCGADR